MWGERSRPRATFRLFLGLHVLVSIACALGESTLPFIGSADLKMVGLTLRGPPTYRQRREWLRDAEENFRRSLVPSHLGHRAKVGRPRRVSPTGDAARSSARADGSSGSAGCGAELFRDCAVNEKRGHFVKICTLILFLRFFLDVKLPEERRNAQFKVPVNRPRRASMRDLFRVRASRSESPSAWTATLTVGDSEGRTFLIPDRVSGPG